MVKPVLLVGDEFTVPMQFAEMLEGRKGGPICFYRVPFWPISAGVLVKSDVNVWPAAMQVDSQIACIQRSRKRIARSVWSECFVIGRMPG